MQANKRNCEDTAQRIQPLRTQTHRCRNPYTLYLRPIYDSIILIRRIKFFALRMVRSCLGKAAKLCSITFITNGLHRMLAETNGTKRPRKERFIIRVSDLFGRAALPFRPVKSAAETH